MGRKSSDGNSSSTMGATATATVMGLRMIQCGRQTVDVIQPDGQVRQFVLPVRVSDLLLLYPHHFVSHATTASATAAAAAAKRGAGGGGYASTISSSSSSSIMLPSDAFLETGSIYVILPLPRLFPLAPPPTPHLCSCFYPLLRAADESTTSSIAAAIKAEFKRHLPVLGGAAAAAAAPSSSFSSRISPEDHSAATSSGIIGLSSSSSTSPLQLMPRRLWEPALEIISEDRLLVLNSNSNNNNGNNAFSTSSSKDKDKDDYHHDYCSSSGPKQDNQLAKKLVSAVLNLNKFRSPPPPPTSAPSSSSSSSSSSPPPTTAA